MRKTILFVVIAIAFSITNVHAAIITVDNKTPSAGDYSSLQAAHDAASPGDTIYVSPSGVPYSLEAVTKKLTFYGTGFDYPAEGMNTTLLKGTMTFGPGADGSELNGFGNIDGFYVVIDANDITIKRNKLSGIVIETEHSGSIIMQNYIYRSIFLWQDGYTLIHIDKSNEAFISNNVVMNPGSGQHNSNNKCISANDPSITLTILHNAFYLANIYADVLDVETSNKFIANNIILQGYCKGCSSNSFYNMGDSEQFPDSNGNIRNVDMDTVFIDPIDDLHLLPDSPAIGAGMNGVDMGIYGGSTPFVDGGRPGLPSIVNLEADHMGSQLDGLDVTVRAKSNRE